MAIVEMKNVSRVYTGGDHELWAPDHLNLTPDAGEFVVILGPGGSGKSTLLNLPGRHRQPHGGQHRRGGQGYRHAQRRRACRLPRAGEKSENPAV